MVVSQGQNQNLIIANQSFENVTKFMYLGTTLRDETCVHEKLRAD
jgi:hypothetical protein